jgi:hypothetical protein
MHCLHLHPHPGKARGKMIRVRPKTKYGHTAHFVTIFKRGKVVKHYVDGNPGVLDPGIFQARSLFCHAESLLVTGRADFSVAQEL